MKTSGLLILEFCYDIQDLCLLQVLRFSHFKF